MVESTRSEIGATLPDGYRIVTLPGSLEALGLVLSELAQRPPFSAMNLKFAHEAIRYQLRYGCNGAALDEQGRLISYVGWARTVQAQAELWLQGKTHLKVVARDFDAIVCTVVLSKDAALTRTLIRRARRLNSGKRVYFKRTYAVSARPERKNSVIL